MHMCYNQWSVGNGMVLVVCFWEQIIHVFRGSTFHVVFWSGRQVWEVTHSYDVDG